jgi:methyl-accepting chemotaxis protein
MPDLLKMDKLIQSLEKSAETLNQLSERLASSMEKMTETLGTTQKSIEVMAQSVNTLADRTGGSLEEMNKKFDKLIETLVKLSNNSPLLNPRSAVENFLKR